MADSNFSDDDLDEMPRGIFDYDAVEQAWLEDPVQALVPYCPLCKRRMSNREAAEQGTCNDCYDLRS